MSICRHAGLKSRFDTSVTVILQIFSRAVVVKWPGVCFSVVRVTPASQVHYRGAAPPDAMQRQRLKKQRCLSPRELVQVQVEEVDSPGHFYVSYSNSEEAQAMDNMMLEMR